MTGYRIVVRWSGLVRKGFITIGENTRYFHRPLSWLQVFDVWYIPEVQHLEARDTSWGPKRALSSDELAVIAKKVCEIGAQLRPIDDML